MKKILILTAIIMSSFFAIAMDNATKYDLKDTYEAVSELIGINEANVLVTNLPPSYKLHGQDVTGATVFYEETNTYIIYIVRGLHISTAIKTLVHEMVHVWQLHSGKLIHLNSDIVLWQGWMRVDINKNRIDNPWEREAYELTPLILKKIKEEKKIKLG